jgi:hypothetical protein
MGLIKPWFVVACPMDFRARIDQFIGDILREVNNSHYLSVAQSTDGLAKSLDNQDWVAVPHHFAFDEAGLGDLTPLGQMLAKYQA